MHKERSPYLYVKKEQRRRGCSVISPVVIEMVHLLSDDLSVEVWLLDNSDHTVSMEKRALVSAQRLSLV